MATDWLRWILLLGLGLTLCLGYALKRHRPAGMGHAPHGLMIEPQDPKKP